MVFNPVYEFESMRKILDSLFEGTPSQYGQETDYNLVNLFENDNHYMLQFIAPGIKQEEVNVHYENGILKVGIQRKTPETAIDGYKLLRKERQDYEFNRTYRLSDNADVEKISAKIVDGLLLVQIPKREESKPKKIEVKVN